MAREASTNRAARRNAVKEFGGVWHRQFYHDKATIGALKRAYRPEPKPAPTNGAGEMARRVRQWADIRQIRSHTITKYRAMENSTLMVWPAHLGDKAEATRYLRITSEAGY